MRAMVLERQDALAANSEPLALRDVPAPDPGPGEVVIDVTACGVCHTDLHVIEGDLAPHKLPIVPGHEIVGAVARIGEGVAGFAVGDAVCAPWLHSTCGKCRYCRRGRENLCENALFTGWDTDGGYAEQVLTHADFTYALPAGMDPIRAAPLLCAGVIGYRALRLAGGREVERLGMFGFGASAHIAIQVAHHWGSEVCVFTRSEGHQRLARKLGAEWVGRAGDAPPRPLDAAIIFSPLGSHMVDALSVVDRGGVVISAGIHMSDIPQFPYSLLYHERSLSSVANSTSDDVRELLQLAAEIGITTEVSTLVLEDANLAVRLVKASRIDGAAVLVPH